jgi:hypothetical protein
MLKGTYSPSTVSRKIPKWVVWLNQIWKHDEAAYEKSDYGAPVALQPSRRDV